ncbi:vacuolar 8-like isoform X1 [Pelobates cultripes]|uniref:Vacuolar protein 8 n=1 Tax=Pelobates cultripes TaxID=61616 RepID=A0AAD1VSH8_PELCU|nr:vacuolar 8-like isoform X1 [Pelobates cultripes]CAH2250423.1 vacuolar 8-like isoform X1 [Pelobates cultripes]
MGRLCDKCIQLMHDFVSFVKRLSTRIVEKIQECVVRLNECCFMSRKTRVRQLYEPVLQKHERQAAQDFLDHMEAGLQSSPLGKETLDALKILAFSENADLQHSAALYYLHMSQHLNAPLPAEYLGPYQALLQSSDLEVQQMSSLSLVNFLLEGNLNKELVVHVGLLEPVLELLESGDSAVQCNSCACVMTLAMSESNREAIGVAGGILPLLTLAKSYDPRVQQNAVGAILNLTRSERIKSILCRKGALPVLTLLLQSDDAEIQYYSCASLGNIAANPDHHQAMLAIGDGFILSMLVSLMSSSVQKVSSQACLCLNNLASTGEVRTHLLSMDIMPFLLTLLNSSNKDVRQASITLLCTLSHPPGSVEAALCEEMLRHLAALMQTERTNPVVLIHASCTIQNLIREENMEMIIHSPCFEELLLALVNPCIEEEELQYVAACVGELAKHDITRVQVIRRKEKALIKRLVQLAGQLEHRELSFQAASVIKELSYSVKIVSELNFHMKEVQSYLMSFLIDQEMRFQHLGIATLCLLKEDPDFSLAIGQSCLKEQLEQIRQQTEETQALLRVVISQTDNMNLNE